MTEPTEREWLEGLRPEDRAAAEGFDPDELVRWAETYGHSEGWAKRAQAAHARAEKAEAERDGARAALRGVIGALTLKDGETHRGLGDACGEDACVACWLLSLAEANVGDA